MPASQTEALQHYLALLTVRPSWAGSLLLSVGLDNAGKALAFASLAAGAASLFLESDQGLIRAAQREGCTTFTVTTLDEALRILKNEIRQGRAVSVALAGDPAQWISAMLERGVAPECIAGTTQKEFLDWGAAAIPGVKEAEAWEDIAENYAQRRQRDAQRIHEATEEIDRRWLTAAPSLFPRDLVRVVRRKPAAPQNP